MTNVLIVQNRIGHETPPSARSQTVAATVELARSDQQTIGQSQLPADPKLRVRRAILHGPILATMLKLAWPTILVLVAAVGVAETFYVSFLGTATLAGVALVFPILMPMTMMSNGAVGGGVASALARAIGAGQRVTHPFWDVLGLNAACSATYWV